MSYGSYLNPNSRPHPTDVINLLIQSIKKIQKYYIALNRFFVLKPNGDENSSKFSRRFFESPSTGFMYVCMYVCTVCILLNKLCTTVS